MVKVPGLKQKVLTDGVQFTTAFGMPIALRNDGVVELLSGCHSAPYLKALTFSIASCSHCRGQDLPGEFLRVSLKVPVKSEEAFDTIRKWIELYPSEHDVISEALFIAQLLYYLGARAEGLASAQKLRAKRQRRERIRKMKREGAPKSKAVAALRADEALQAALDRVKSTATY